MESPQRITALILAAGRGKRMRSDLPKVLHSFGGEPLLFRPIRAAQAAGATRVIVIVGHGEAQVRESVAVAFGDRVEFARQPDPRGTGHAAQCALPTVGDDDAPVLILSGDVPLLKPETLNRLHDASAGGLALGTFAAADPTGYGRIVRDSAAAVTGIVEHRDASEAQRQISECNGGVYCIAAGPLREHLAGLDADNSQGELYLTDLVAAFVRAGLPVTAVDVPELELTGVNTPEQLADLERSLVG